MKVSLKKNRCKYDNGMSMRSSEIRYECIPASYLQYTSVVKDLFGYPNALQADHNDKWYITHKQKFLDSVLDKNIQLKLRIENIQQVILIPALKEV